MTYPEPDLGPRGTPMTLFIRAALALLPLLLAIGGAGAQAWPSKPIRFIVTQAAGGTPAIICRLLGDRLSRALGQQAVVENRPGAGNTIGMQMAARAAPDGYTFVFATAAALVTNPYTFKSLPYDPVADFVPVAMVAKGPFIALTHPSVPAKTLGELLVPRPARTPAEIVARMNRELDKILKDPAIVSQLATVGFFTEGADTPEATRAFVRSQHDLWGKVAHDIGLRPE